MEGSNEERYSLSQIQDLIEGGKEEQQQAEGLYEGQDMVKIIKTYVEENVPNDIVESEVAKAFWAFMGKNIVLSFIEEGDEEMFEKRFNVAKWKFIQRYPPYKYTQNMDQIFDQLKFKMLIELKRAKGIQSGKINERTALISQFQHSTQSKTEQFTSGPQPRKGVMQTLAGMFG